MTSETLEAYNVPRGTAYLTSQQFIVYTTYFLFYILIARTLTKEQVGQVSLLSAAFAVFNTFTSLALPQTATRFISRNLAHQQPQTASAVAHTILRVTLTLAIPSTLLAVTFSPLLSGPLFGSQPLTLIATFISGLLIDLTLLYGAYFLGIGDYAAQVYQNILYVPLSRGTGLLLAILGYGVEGVILGWVIGGIATLLLSLYLWHNRLPHGTSQPVRHLLAFTLSLFTTSLILILAEGDLSIFSVKLGWITGGVATLILLLYLWRRKLPRGSSHPVKPLLAFTMPLFTASIITLGQQWGDITILQFRLGQLSTTGGYYLVVSSVTFLSILWTPVATALLPALSASHATDGPRGVAERLSLATRFTNLGVLPLSASLAALAPTALTIAYGPAYTTSESIPLVILALSSIFIAQAAILGTTLQAIGKIHRLLQITAVATIVDLATVATLATVLGPAAGAIGRALLYITTVYLSGTILKQEIKTHTFQGISKSIILSLGVALPLFALNQLLILENIRPLLRLPLLIILFAACFLLISRKLSIFHRGDFALMKDALPRRFHPFLRRIEHLIIGPPKPDLSGTL